MNPTLSALLARHHGHIGFRINQYEGSHLLDSFTGTPEADTTPSSATIGILDADIVTMRMPGPDNSLWAVCCHTESREDGVDLRVRFELERGNCPQTNVSLCLDFDAWSEKNYVLMPAGAYNGNRYEAMASDYPPSLFGKRVTGPDMPTIISDVPRLNIGDGPSLIRLMTRDLATPAIGFHMPETGEGFWLLTEQRTCLGDSAIELEESEDRSRASLRISAPGVRPDFRYIIANTHFPSEDNAHDFNLSDVVELKVRLYAFPCKDIQTLFDKFTDIRKELTPPPFLKNLIPFSAAWDIQEKKYNQQNWVEQQGYFSVGMRENPVQDWQVGWTGGMIATYPLLFAGAPLSRERALRNFDFLFDKGQDKSGLFYGLAYQGVFFGDYDEDASKRGHLIRRSGDALYYIIKQFHLMNRQEPATVIPVKWLQGTRCCADALVRLWDTYGQFGQFADSLNGTILIGGSACGGIVPAALALAGECFGDCDYLRVAKQSAQHFYENFVKLGVTTGGPGDMLQCPDSESAFGLLESFMTLYEVDGGERWLSAARDMANQCFTWCVSYDYPFPPESTFGKLGMQTTGTVYANVQNKHSAPGICTHSGLPLLKLYRATGDEKYLTLIQEMAHNMPQYLSQEDRPIQGLVNYWVDFRDGNWHPENMPAGWMNERVQMSDWLEPIGEVFWGSCWSEVSNMLTYIEIPGLYVQPDTGFLCVIDHVEAKVISRNADGVKVQIHNPTDFDATVKVFVEPSTAMKTTLGQNALWDCQRIHLAPGASIHMVFK